MAKNYVKLVSQGNLISLGPPPVTGTLYERGRAEPWLSLTESLGLTASPAPSNTLVVSDTALAAMAYSKALGDAVGISASVSEVEFDHHRQLSETIAVTDRAGLSLHVSAFPPDSVLVTDSVVAVKDGSYSNTKSLYFDGTDDASRATGLHADISTSGYTISYWMKRPDESQGANLSYNNTLSYSTTGVTPYQGSLNKGTSTITVWTGAPWDQLWTTGTYDGAWVHICFTSTTTTSAAGTNHAYLNGVQLGSVGSRPALASALDCWTVSAQADSSVSRFFEAYLDEMAICAGVVAPSNFYAGGVFSGGPADLSGVSGLKHWWRCGDGAGDVGGASSVIYDQAGSANLVQFSGAPVISTDVPFNYKSMAFDGSDDLFATGSGGGLPNNGGTSPYSLSFWVNVNSLPLSGSKACIGSHPNNSPGNKPRLQWKFYDTGKVIVIINGDSYAFSSQMTPVITTGSWHHYVVTDLGLLQASPAAFHCYMDGSLMTNGAWQGMDYSYTYDQELMIGGLAQNTYTEYVDCVIDEVGVWRSHVLSQTEVENIFNGTPGTSGSGSPTDLENTAGVTAPDSYWRMGDLDDTDGSSGVIYDRIGSYNLTAGSGNGSGAPSVSTSTP